MWGEDLYHRSEGKDPYDKLGFIVFVISYFDQVFALINLYCFFFKVRKMEQHSFQCISLINELELHCLEFRLIGSAVIDVKWLVVRLTGYDSPEIDSVSISVPGTDQPELIILLRVFQLFRHYHYISHIVFS